MKKITIFVLLFTSFSAYCDYCGDINNHLDIDGIGTIVFEKTQECQEAVKILNDCKVENHKKFSASPPQPTIDCKTPLKTYIISHNNKILMTKP
jgi:hypothetical protein